MHFSSIAKVKNSILNYNNIRHKHMNNSKVWKRALVSGEIKEWQTLDVTISNIGEKRTRDWKV